eukprot:scaffold4521_cov388-Prasinococcus_capsulatus_cf.AAC.3
MHPAAPAPCASMATAAQRVRPPSRARACRAAARGRAPLRRLASASASSDVAADPNWRQKAQPIKPGSQYPAKEFCSSCGLCDTYYVAHVKEACAFLGNGMSDVEAMEEQLHGRPRDLATDDLHYGVHTEMLYAKRKRPVEGAQWTGIVTSIALAMLEQGLVEAVVAVGSDEQDRFKPKPIIATTREEVLSTKGVKPSLSPNLMVGSATVLGPAWGKRPGSDLATIGPTLAGACGAGSAGLQEGPFHWRGLPSASAEKGGEVPGLGEAVRDGDQLHRQRAP